MEMLPNISNEYNHKKYKVKVYGTFLLLTLLLLRTIIMINITNYLPTLFTIEKV